MKICLALVVSFLHVKWLNIVHKLYGYFSPALALERMQPCIDVSLADAPNIYRQGNLGVHNGTSKCCFFFFTLF